MMTEPGNNWGTDTMISMPQPSQHDILVDMGTFGFTEFGLNHNLSRADLEDYIPTFAPENIALDG